MIEELRERDRSCLSSMNLRLTAGPQCRNRKGHGDPVVRSRVDHCAMKLLTSGNGQPILELGELSAHGTQVLRNHSNAIRLLHPKLLCIANSMSVARISGI